MSAIDLYHPIIISRNKAPKFHLLKLEGTVIDAYNPVCGDEFKIALKIAGNKITSASFRGYGCAVSTAAIDMLIEKIIDKTSAQAFSILNDYLEVLKMDCPPDVYDEPLAVFQKVKNHPARKECATLGATAIIGFLTKKNYNDK